MALNKDDLKQIKLIVSEESEKLAIIVANSFQRVENTLADHSKQFEEIKNIQFSHENKFSNHERRIGTLESRAGIAEGSAA